MQLEIKEYRWPQRSLWWQKTHRWLTIVQMRAAILEKTAGGTEEGVNQTGGMLWQGQKCVNSISDIWFGLNRAHHVPWSISSYRSLQPRSSSQLILVYVSVGSDKCNELLVNVAHSAALNDPAVVDTTGLVVDSAPGWCCGWRWLVKSSHLCSLKWIHPDRNCTIIVQIKVFRITEAQNPGPLNTRFVGCFRR